MVRAPRKSNAADAREGDRLFVGSVARCFRVLEVLASADRPLPLSEIVRRVAFDKSAEPGKGTWHYIPTDPPHGG